MAKNVQAPAGPEQEAGHKPNSKKLIIIGGGVLLLLIAAAVAAFLLLSKPPGHDDEEDNHDKKPAEAEVKIPNDAKPLFIPLETFTVNLQGGEQYLQLGINLKFYKPELDERIKLTMPEIRSKILLLLSSKHPEELMTSEGKNKLAQDILVEIAPTLGIKLPSLAEGEAEGKPQRLPVEVLFTSFIIQ